MTKLIYALASLALVATQAAAMSVPVPALPSLQFPEKPKTETCKIISQKEGVTIIRCTPNP